MLNHKSKLQTMILVCLTMWFAICLPFAVSAQTDEVWQLPPNQTIEREMTGVQTHRYQFELKANEFFQVRVEQKGVDVALKLLNADGTQLATMDSPNGKEGFETLTFVALNDGAGILEVISSDEKAEKGNYILKRETSRAATDEDKKRVEIEKNFVESVAEVIAMANDYAKGEEILTKNFNKVDESKDDAVSARIKLKEALIIFRSVKPKAENENLSKKISLFGSKESEKLLAVVKEYAVLSGFNEALTLDRIAQSHYYLGEWSEYLDYKKLAVAAYQAVLKYKDHFESSEGGKRLFFAIRASIAQNLDNIGSTIHSRYGNFEESIRYSEQAIELYQILYQETQDKKYKISEAINLVNIALVYDKQSKNKSKALEYFTKSLVIFRSIPEAKSFVAQILSSIGAVHVSLLDFTSARKNKEESLKIYTELNDKHGQADILNSFALMYLILNNQPKFNEYMKLSLDILESPDYEENWKNIIDNQKKSILSLSTGKDVFDEITDNLIKRTRLNKIAFSYELLKEFEKSLDYYKQSLEVARASKEPTDIKSGLTDVAFILVKLEKWDEAVNFYQQALEISRSSEDKEIIAKDLQNLGFALLESGKYKEALSYQNEALTIYQSVEVDENKSFSAAYSNLLNEISRTHYALGNKRLAILYAKRAVNAIQGERQRLQNLDAVSQKGFLENKEKPYRRLADWLIEEGKFAQAEQVLAMLKEEEYFDFVRRDASEIGKLDERVPLNEKEKALIARYSLLADKITEIGQEFIKLDDKKRRFSQTDLKLSAEEQARYAELEGQLEVANAAFQLFLTKELVAEIGEQKKGEIEIDRNMQAKLRKWGEGTVALYTVAGAERYRVVLTTPTGQFSGKYEIKIKELNEKVFAFRAALQNPNVDPRPLGKELYDILVKPVEKELKAANAKTLVWSLDGTLRYIPLAALSPDGKRYFVEDVQNVIITPKTRDDMTNSDSNWEALGLGVSDAQTVANPDDKSRSFSFDPLTGTQRELLAIVRDEKSSGETGVLPGRRLMNKDFTNANFKDSLGKENEDGKRKYNVIHIASHFRLGSNWSNSFLLLGNGEILTLEDINNSPTIDFGDVELITLSACNTGFADDSNGKEIDSLASVIQTKSGKAVLATLWAVSDNSTSLLMSEFYRLRKENPKLTKAEAMQTAQQELIRGEYKTLEEANANRSELVGAGKEKSNLPAFKKDEKTPFAHPYYWSPFILIGNWK